MLLKKYYMPIFIVATVIVLIAILRVQNWGLASLLVLAVALIGTNKDAKQISWERFLPAGFITLFIFYLIFQYGNPMWHQVVGWQFENVRHRFEWNDWFNSIPYNDAAFMRVWQPALLKDYMQWVYMNGFTLSYWICVIRAFFTKDVRKLALYSMAGYLLQVPLILPFYNTILLQEVWFVQGTPDLLERGLTGTEAFTTAWNCFPSMHTSIAFAAILLSFREKSPWFRWVIGIYGWSIIISTLYLQVHWVIDMFAGMLFAYGMVKLADLIVNSKAFAKFADRFENLSTGWTTRPSLDVVAPEVAASKETES